MKKEVWLNHSQGIEQINTLGKEKTPFLFILSYDKQKIFAQALDSLDKDVFYKLKTYRNYPEKKEIVLISLSSFLSLLSLTKTLLIK